MNEGQFTSKLLAAIRKERPGAIVGKISDRYTGGYPDFFVCDQGRTTWCEVKMANASRGRMFEPLQFETAKRMHAWYLIWSRDRKVGYLFLASEMVNCAWHETEPCTFAEIIEKIKRTF